MKQPFRSLQNRFYQSELGHTLEGNLISYSHGVAQWEFKVWNVENYNWVYQGNLQETIELILLGKLMKDKMVNGKVTIEEKAKATQGEPIAIIEEA